MRVDVKKCVGCGLCVEVCPLELISLEDKKAKAERGCVLCGACAKVCPKGAVELREEEKNYIICDSCPVSCRIPPGGLGACKRFTNRDGRKVRTIRLHTFDDVQDLVKPDLPQELKRPLVTGIGAGTTYPDYRPAPFIVKGEINGVDVVTVVTEAPLSYSGAKVKIDTDLPIGEEGADVLDAKGRKVGHVTTEEYGSKIISIGGANILTGRNGMWAAKLVADIANRRPFQLKVKGGADLKLQVGRPPEIDGVVIERMRVGCGSATMGMFAREFFEAADEVVVIDSHITGVFSEHAAGRFLGKKPSGIKIKFTMSTPGRYFGDHGDGWGGTSIKDPLDLIEGVDERVARRGFTILFTETTGERAKMFRWLGGMEFEEIPLTEGAKRAVELIRRNCEPSMVSALYAGGAGGSLRESVVRFPIELTRAVHERRARLTVGGAEAFILPGGGINFLVDVSQVKVGSFTWIPTPCTVAPIEFTMRLEDYERMGGYTDSIVEYNELVRILSGK